MLQFFPTLPCKPLEVPAGIRHRWLQFLSVTDYNTKIPLFGEIFLLASLLFVPLFYSFCRILAKPAARKDMGLPALLGTGALTLFLAAVMVFLLILMIQ